MNKTMKKLSKYFCLSAIALGLWSCSKDDVVETPIQTFGEDSAWMQINICAPSEGSRATGDVSEGSQGTSGVNYANGSDDENHVSKLSFYFYDKAGEFVTKSEGTYTPTTSASHLVEEVGTSKIVLTNLLGKNYPSYVIAVLNYSPSSSSDAFAQSLSAVRNAARSSNPWTTRTSSYGDNPQSTTTDFVMTNATHNENSEDFWYFATPITEENFALQPDGSAVDGNWNETELKVKPVNIYVERIAAKVQLSFPGYTLNNGVYEVVIKNPENTDEERYFDIYVGKDKEGKDIIEKKTLKVKLTGWGLNGIAKSMKYMKAVNDAPNAFVTTDGWNYEGTHRCYWAKTPKYGTGNYPNDFGSVTNKTGIAGTIYDDDAAINESLKYISWDDVNNNSFKQTNMAYVIPHTEAGAQINLSGEIRHSAITEVLISAQIVDAEGHGVTLYEIGGTLYTEVGAKNYVLNAAGAHIYKEKEVKYVDADGNEVSKETPDATKIVTAVETITSDDVVVEYDYDGAFKLVLTDDAKKENWYRSYSVVTEGEGDDLVVKSYTLEDPYEVNTKDGKTTYDVETEINSFLPDKQTYCYKDGKMYYNVAIRHLRSYTKGEEIKTGHFGVVRNHCYQINVGNITNLGHAVYRPSEHIIPPSDDTRYMIGSSVNILSWRMVYQNTEL